MIVVEEQLDMAELSVADVALAYPQGLEILNRYNLDYCCGGKKPFVKVCEKAGLNPESIWQEIQLAVVNQGGDTRMRFSSWDAPLLIDFIVQHHHQYVRDSIPQIQALLDKVCHAHGEDSPFLLTVREKFNSLAVELLNHLPKEEEVLFPAIRKLAQRGVSELESSVAQKQLKAPIVIMEDEHEIAGVLIKSIRSLTSHYTPPVFACPTFKITYIMLNQFDKDLMQHIHLENNILFPKVLGA
jgi:regulator of cell morphogenesis and NO signaling